MRVLLILPRSSPERETLSDFTFMLRLLTPRGSNGRKGVMAFMPLALPTLAALTPRHIDVRIIDENIEDIPFDDPVDIVGISFVSSMASRAYEIADVFRKRKVHVALGGVHTTLMPEEAQAHADSVFVGEAESTWPEFLRDFEAGVPKTRYLCCERPSLQTAVLPRWDLVSNKHYLVPLIQTTRGCNFACNFCSVRTLFGPPRTKPVAHVIREIEQVAKLHKRPGRLKLMFADDNIVADVAYAKELFKAMIPLRLRWSSQASINIAQDDELLRLARESGCDTLLIGVESISQRSLNGAGKGGVNKVELFGELMRSLHASGINVYSYIIFGFDEDDAFIFERTLSFVQEMAIEFPLFNLLTPIPGTRFYDSMKQQGRVVTSNFVDLNGYTVTFQPRSMSEKTLLDGFHWAIAQAYSEQAILERIRKGYDNGALKGSDPDTISRIAASALVLLDLLRHPATPEFKRFARRIVREMWRSRNIKINALLMFLDRYHFAEKLKRHYPEAVTFGHKTVGAGAGAGGDGNDHGLALALSQAQ